MVEWGNYAEAYKAIHSKLEEILAKLDYPIDSAVLYFSKSSTDDLLDSTNGKAVKILGFFFYTDADITAELRFKTSGNVVGGIKGKGAVGMNLVGMKKPQGATDELVEMYISGSGNVKGWFSYEEV